MHTVEPLSGFADPPKPNGRVDILLPPPLQGSGGHRTAVAGGEALGAAGFEVHIHFQSPGPSSPEGVVAAQAREWHGVESSAGHVGWPESFGESDVVIGTTWQSAVFLAGARTDGVRVHFVQDYEAWFHPMGDAYLAAQGVHDLGLATITIGEWLRHRLWRHHGLRAWSIPFTADPTLYAPSEGQGSGPPRIVAMYQPQKPRRCAALMEATLRTIMQRRPDVEVVTVGSEAAPDLGRGHRHLGLVDREELPAVYASGAVGFSISASNPSRVPFEMMAAGLPVVELGSENTIYDLPDSGCLLARPDPESMAAAIIQLLDDQDRRERMSGAASTLMLDKPADREAEAFVAAVAAVLAGDLPPTEEPEAMYRAPILVAEESVPWSGGDPSAMPAVDPAATDEAVLINQELNVVNHELNRANHELNTVNSQLHAANTELHAVNTELDTANRTLNEANLELLRRLEEADAELMTWRRRYAKTLEGRVISRLKRKS